jgi:protein-tyrosine-phosphatase
MARGADLVIVMDVSQAKRIVREFGISAARIAIAGDLDSSISPTRSITDPWMQAADVFESTFDRLDRCAETVASALSQAYSSR